MSKAKSHPTTEVDYVSPRDWTFGCLPDDQNKIRQGLLMARTMFQSQVNLCHDLMDMSSWSRKDPMAYLAECYRAAAIGLQSVDEGLLSIGIDPKAPVAAKTPVEQLIREI